MNIEDVKVGLQVIPEGSRYDLSTIASMPNAEGYVTCQYPSGKSYQVHVDDLDLYDAAVEKEAILDAQNQLNQSTQLFEKAFAMLQMARATAESVHHDLSNRDHFDVSALDEVIDKNGWSSSSIWC